MKQKAPSINYHLVKPCNMRCKFCFATFHDIGNVKHDFEKSEFIIKEVAKAGFEKINFAGGEPTLIKELPELIEVAKDYGLTTSLVTNGLRLLDNNLLSKLSPNLDWIAISIDSLDQKTNLESGRALVGRKPLSEKFYCKLIKEIKKQKLKLKINTVVSSYNHQEDMSDFIKYAEPERWKILQALRIKGQNDQHVNDFEITEEEFKLFIQRHEKKTEQLNTQLITEYCSDQKGTYIMISPERKLYDNTGEHYTYSRDIQEVGIIKALDEINFDYDGFIKRGGLYKW